MCTLFVHVLAQPLNQQALQELTCRFTGDAHQVTKHLVEFFIFLIIFEVFAMCSVVGINGSSMSLTQLSFDVEGVFHKVLERP